VLSDLRVTGGLNIFDIQTLSTTLGQEKTEQQSTLVFKTIKGKA